MAADRPATIRVVPDTALPSTVADLTERCRRCGGRTHDRSGSGRRRFLLVAGVLSVVVVGGLVPATAWSLYAGRHDPCWDDELGVVGGRKEPTSDRSSPNASESTSSVNKFVKYCTAFDNQTGTPYDTELTSAVTSADLSFYDDDIEPTPFTKILHRMWKTDKVPSVWRRGVDSCRLLNRDFIYCHWTDPELDSFIAAEYPDFLPTYRSYAYDIQRADAARYHLLYHYGGVYLDLDIVCRIPFSRIVGRMPTRVRLVAAEAEPFGVAGDFLAVRRPRDPLVGAVISGLRPASLRYYPLPYVAVMFGTGPVFLSRRIAGCSRTGSDLDDLTSPVFVVRSADYGGVYFRHLVGSSWHRWDGWLIWRLYQLRRGWPVKVVVLVGLVGVVAFLKVARLRRACVTGWRQTACCLEGVI